MYSQKKGSRIIYKENSLSYIYRQQNKQLFPICNYNHHTNDVFSQIKQLLRAFIGPRNVFLKHPINRQLFSLKRCLQLHGLLIKPIYQLISPSINHSINHLTNQPTNQSINRSLFKNKAVFNLQICVQGASITIVSNSNC